MINLPSQFNTKKTISGFLKKLTVFFCIFSIGTSSLITLPQKTEAIFVPVLETNPVIIAHDLELAVKEGVLDALAWNIAKLAIGQITGSIVNWINSGFDGNPAFITNPLQFFGDIADNELGAFLEGTELGLLCSPFQVEIRRALIINQNGGGFGRKASCKLSDILDNIQNYDDFVSIRDLSSVNTRNIGGWEDWYQVAARPEGNVYGAYQAAQAELSLRIRNKSFSFEKELDWGSGFLSFRDCPDNSHAQAIEGADCPIVTPGKVIEDQLSETLGSGVRQLEIADEFDEIIGALIGQLVSQLGSKSGLFGLSQPNSSSGGDGRSYIENLQLELATTTANRNFTKKGMDQNTKVFEEFIRIKNLSISKIDISIDIQRQLISCSGGTGDNSTITNTLTPLKNEILDSITAANGNIQKLNEFKGRLEVLNLNTGASSTTIKALQDLQIDYIDFLTETRIEQVLYGAEQEFTYTIPEILKQIDIDGKKALEQCLDSKNGGGNGGGGGGKNS